MINFLRKILNPSCYQGAKKNSRHFEGWYFKLVDKSEGHSFIQVFNGSNDEAHYFKFQIGDFHAKDHVFDIQIQSNRFSSNRIALDVGNSSFEMKGELRFKHLTPWPRTLISPGIMGWYTWVPFMECYHGIVSLDHEIQGSLSVNGRDVDFSNGRGYTEKDWGRSFPEAWIWCQSNHFSSAGVAFTGSIAVIPWIRGSFLGFIFGLRHGNRLYRFATYTGARLVRLEMDDSKVRWAIKQKNTILEITVNRSEGSLLQAPTENGMTRRISETLKSMIEIKLSRRSNKGDEIIFDDTGRHAGFEIAGNPRRLLEMVKGI
jgi:hypothetical protein